MALQALESLERGRHKHEQPTAAAVEEQLQARQQAGTLAVRVWTLEDGVVYERKPDPPYTVTLPKTRACGDRAKEILGKAEPLAVSETGYRILKLWVPDDPFTGRVYYIVPIKAKVRGRKRTCIRVFENLDDAVMYTLYPPRGSEPA